MTVNSTVMHVEVTSLLANTDMYYPRSQASPVLFFGLYSVQYTAVEKSHSSTSVYYTEHKLKNINGGGLGTRLGVYT